MAGNRCALEKAMIKKFLLVNKKVINAKLGDRNTKNGKFKIYVSIFILLIYKMEIKAGVIKITRF